MLEFLTQSTWTDRIGWTLVHSLWQFVLAAFLAFALQWMLRRRSAAARYRALLIGMALLVAAPTATWFSLPSADVPVAEVEFSPVEKTENVSPPQLVFPSQPRDDAPAMAVRPMESPEEIVAAKPPAEAQVLQPAAIDVASIWTAAKRCVQPWLAEIVLVWLAGVLAAAFRPLFGWRMVRRLRTVGVLPVGGAVQDALERTAKRLKLGRAVEVLQSALVKTPMVVGYFRPAILLPLCVVTGLPAAQLELILAHELAHIRRHDYLVNLLQTLVETLFFYHPAVWWLSRQIRNERENCCDDVAMAAVGNRADYGRALLAIEELRAASPTLSLAARGGSFLARIRRIAGCEPAPRVVGSGSVLSVVLVSFTVFAAMTWGAGEPRGQSEPIDISKDLLPEDAVLRLGTVRLRHRSFPTCVVFSPDGRTIASAGSNQDMAVNLWDAATGRLIRRLTDPELKHGWTEAIAFSPDGTRLASSRADGVALVTDVQSGRILCKTKKVKQMQSIAFAPDGSRFASGGSDGIVHLWNAADGTELKVIDTALRLPKDSDYPGGWGIPVMAFSPDGKWLAIATGGPHGAETPIPPKKTAANRNVAPTPSLGDAAIQIWNIASGKLVTTIDHACGEAVGSIVFTRDGKYLVSGGNGRIAQSEFGKPFHAKTVQIPEIRVWNPTTGKKVRELTMPEPEAGFGRMALSDDNKLLASGADEAIRLWDFSSGKTIGTIPIAGWWGSQGLALSPDGKTVATGRKNSLVLWDTATHKPILQDFDAHTGSVGHVAYSPDGATIYTGAQDGRAMAWDAQSGKRLYQRAMGRSPTISAMALSPDGRLLAAGGYVDWHHLGSQSVVRLWHAKTGEAVRDFVASEKHYGRVHRIAFSPDGKLLAIAAEMGRSNSADIDIWEIESGKKVCEIRLAHENLGVCGMEFSTDSSTLFDVQSAELRAWDVKTGKLRQTIVPHTEYQLVEDGVTRRARFAHAVFSPDRKWLITSQGASMVVWDVATGRSVSTVKLPGTDKGRYLGISRDGRWLAAAETLYCLDLGDGAVAICNLDPVAGSIRLVECDSAKAARALESCDGRALAFAFSPDNKRLATGMDGGTALVWDVKAVIEKPEQTSAAASPDATKTVAVGGVVVGQDGRPAAGVSVQALVQGQRRATVESDAQGRFQLRVDRDRVRGLGILARNKDGTQQAFFKFDWYLEPGKPLPQVRLTMSQARSIDVQVLDGKGKPVADAVVGTVVEYMGLDAGRSDAEGKYTLRIPADAALKNIYALKSGLGMDYLSMPPAERATTGDVPQPLDLSRTQILKLDGARTVKIKLIDPEGRPIEGVCVAPWYFQKPEWGYLDKLNIGSVEDFQKKTDAAGVATFDWIPSWHREQIIFWPSAPDQWTGDRITWEPTHNSAVKTALLQRTVPVRGQVRHADGRAAVGILIQAAGSGQASDGFRGQTWTDDNGRFEIRVNPELVYLFTVDDSRWTAAPRDGIAVRPNTPVDGIDFQLQKTSTRLHGQLTVGPEKKPWPGQTVMLTQRGSGSSQESWNSRISRRAITDAEGKYAFAVCPGTYTIAAAETDEQRITVTDQRELVANFQEPRRQRGMITVRVVDQSNPPRPVPRARVVGESVSSMSHARLEATTNGEGWFRVERWLDNMIIYASSKDKKLAGTMTITANDAEITVPLQPVGAAKGRLIDAATGRTMADREMRCWVSYHYEKPANMGSSYLAASARTDAEGRFEIPGLTPGLEYEFSAADPTEKHRYDTIGKMTVKSGQTLDLGDVKFRSVMTPGELLDVALKNREPLDKRLTEMAHEGQKGPRRVLILFWTDKSRQHLLDITHNDFKRFADYLVISSMVEQKEMADAKTAHAKKWGLERFDASWPLFCILDIDGRPFVVKDTQEFAKEGKVDDSLVDAFLKKHALKGRDAGKAVDDIDVRYAVAAAKVAKADFDVAVEANKKVAGTVPKAEMRRLKLEWQKSELAVEKAQKNQDAIAGKAKTTSADDIDVRYAVAAAQVAKADYDEAVEANNKVAGTVSKAEMRRLKLEWIKWELAVEKAKKGKEKPGEPSADKTDKRSDSSTKLEPPVDVSDRMVNDATSQPDRQAYSNRMQPNDAERRRDDVRAEAEEALKKGDLSRVEHVGRELIALPSPPLRDCRLAIRCLESGKDLKSRAKAYEVAAGVMQTIIVAQPSSFTRPTTQTPAFSKGDGPTVEVQTHLDGDWHKCKGTAADWIQWIEHKQHDLTWERLATLGSLAKLYRGSLNEPRKAATALRQGLVNSPFFTMPLDKLLADQWPLKKQDIHENAERAVYVQPARDLAAMLAELGETDAAIDVLSRVVLADYHVDGKPRRDIEKLWRLLQERYRKSPGLAPPLLAAIELLSPERPTVEFNFDKLIGRENWHKTAQINIAARPGYEFDTLELTADMEGQGGYIQVNAEYLPGSSMDSLGSVKWHQDRRKGREVRTASFKVPAGVGVIYFGTARLVGDVPDGVVVHRLAVRGTFRKATDKSAEKTAKPEPALDVSGSVVDDATGKPVGHFVVQGGQVDKNDPTKITWGYGEGGTISPNPQGRFFGLRIDWQAGQRARIVAVGYLPQPILDEASVAIARVIGESRIDNRVVRLTRGAALRGRVVDHDGKPVEGAKVFFHAPTSSTLVPISPMPTDANGRFRVTGSGETTERLVVLAPRLSVWVVSVPQEKMNEELTVRLPRPATLKVVVDIPGAVQEGEKQLVDSPIPRIAPAGKDVRLRLEWKGAGEFVQTRAVANPGEIVFDNLTPGQYDFSRTKTFIVGDGAPTAMCDRQLDLRLAPGETKEIRLVRRRGQRVAGEIRGLPDGIEGAFLEVHPIEYTGDPERRDEWKLPTFDALACPRNGKFETSLLEPGRYAITADAHRRETPEEHDGSHWRLPAFVGRAEVTVSDAGPPPHVTIELRPRGDSSGASTTAAPFRASGNLTARPPAGLRRTTLDLRISAIKNAITPVSGRRDNKQSDVLELPIRIENRSAETITANVAHEWHGGEWPPTDLGAAVRSAGDKPGKWKTSEVYLSGELGSKEATTVWKPGESRDFVLRMNWPGTTTRSQSVPLINAGAPGKYTVRVSLIFRAGELYQLGLKTPQYIVSPDMEIEVREKAPSKTAGESRATTKEQTDPQVAPPALLTASGTVHDPNGKPVAGATVHLREWSTYRGGSDPYTRNPNDIIATTQTDAQGAFRFEKVPAKPLSDQWLKQVPWDVVVVAKPYAIAWRHLDAAQESKPFTFHLTPEARISGQVTDQQGRPVANAEVRIGVIQPLGSDASCGAYADPDVLDLQRSRLMDVAKTDAEGRVTIGGLPSGLLMRLGIYHDAFRGDTTFVATTDKPQPDMEIPDYENGIPKKGKTIKVECGRFAVALAPPLPKLIGRVLAADTKKPLAGARITGWGVPTTLTDQDGQFVLREARQSQCRAIVYSPEGSDYLGRLVIIDVPRDKKETHVDIELPRGEVVSGIVVDDAGQGVAGVAAGFDSGVGMSISEKTAERVLPSYQKTGRDGRFRIAVPAGKGKVVISGPVPGYDVPRWVEREPDDAFSREINVAAGQPSPEAKFTVQRMASVPEEKPAARRDDWLTKARKTVRITVEGQVVDPDGKPAAGAEVGLDQWFRDSEGEFQPVKTDRDGHFSFQMKPLGFSEEFILAIHKERKLRGHFRLESKQQEQPLKTPVKIHLVPTGIVKGSVVEGDKPVAGISIQFSEHVPTPGSSNGSLTCTNRDFAKTDELGRFEFPLVEAGKKFSIHSINMGSYTDAQESGQVEAGKTLEVKPFSLMRTDKSVAGVIVDPEGNPVAGVSVSAELRSGRGISGAFTKRPTGRDGRFVIRGVPNEPLTITAYIRPPDNAKDPRIHFPAQAGAEPGQTDVRIVLDPKLVRGKRVATTASTRQDEMIAAIEKLGGHVKTDPNDPSHPVFAAEFYRSPDMTAGLEALKTFARLQVLDLGGDVTDAGLKHLQNLTQLQEIRIHRTNTTNTNITDAGLKHLEGLVSLRELDLYGTNITDLGLQSIKPLVNLQRLNVGFSGVTDAGLEQIGTFTQLRKLGIGGPRIADAGLRHLKGLSQLESLDLGGTKITDAGLLQIEKLPQLQRLDLAYTKITDAGLKHLRGLSHLRSLTLDRNPITNAGIEHLSDFPELEELIIDAIPISDAGLAHLKDLPRLKKLTLRQTDIKGHGLEHLHGLPQLQHLSLCDSPVQDDGLKHVGQLKQLASLNLWGTQITDAGLKHLQGLSQLKRLDLEETAITDGAVEHLKTLTSLRDLYLESSTKMTNRGVQELQQALPNCRINNEPKD